MATCPKCDAAVLGVSLSQIPVNVGDGTHWDGVAYSCRQCGTVLSVGIDPVVLKNDLLDEILAALRKR